MLLLAVPDEPADKVVAALISNIKALVLFNQPYIKGIAVVEMPGFTAISEFGPHLVCMLVVICLKCPGRYGYRVIDIRHSGKNKGNGIGNRL